MLKLIVFNPAFGAPSASPFCVKAMCLLAMSEAKHQIVFGGDSRKSPKQKLPVLLDGEKVIPDSDAIRSHLEQTLGVDFDAGLTAEQRAISRAVIRMAEEHLYFAAINERWLNDENWEQVRKVFFAPVPAPLRGLVSHLVRKKVRNQIVAQGMGRHSPAEILERIESDLSAIATLLGSSDFLFGTAPTAADASVAPMLEAIATTPVKSEFVRRVSDDQTLMGYVAGVKAAIYPDA